VQPQIVKTKWLQMHNLELSLTHCLYLKRHFLHKELFLRSTIVGFYMGLKVQDNFHHIGRMRQFFFKCQRSSTRHAAK